MKAQELESRLNLALRTAREAGRLTLDYFQQSSLAIERKADNSPVTIADRQAESLLRQRIAEEFPGDGILGEELGEEPGTTGYRWILDPIDGTKSFIHGVPLYGTMVAVEREGRSLVGVVYIPALDECVHAATGQGAWYAKSSAPPAPARVSSCNKLSEGLFCTSEIATFRQIGKIAAYERLESTARLSRTWGDCYGYLLVATGRAEVMVDPVMNVWDAAAVQVILQEAGGTFTDWQGREKIDSGQGVATNGRVLSEVMQLLR